MMTEEDDRDHLAAVLRRWLVGKDYVVHAHYHLGENNEHECCVSVVKVATRERYESIWTTELLAVLKVANQIMEAEGK